MKRIFINTLIIILFLLLSVTTSFGIPTISIDMYPGIPGIQDTIGDIYDPLYPAPLYPGDQFTIDVVFTGDGITTFDTVILDVAFNDMGPRLTLVSGQIVGALIEKAPFYAIDVFGGTPVAAGDTLTTDFIPTASGFTGGIGGAGLASAVQPFSIIGSGEGVDIFSLTFVASTEGISTVSALGFPIGFELALKGSPVPVELAPGKAIVTPEPATLFLFCFSLIGLGVFKRKFGKD